MALCPRENDVPNVQIKHQRRPLACDFCRKRKSRCKPFITQHRYCYTQDKAGNGSQMPNNNCSNCLTYSVDCTYVEASKRSVSKRYIENLENRIAQLEGIFKRVSPDLDLEDIIRNLDQAEEDHVKADVNPGPNDTQATSEPTLSPVSGMSSPWLEHSSPEDPKDVSGELDYVTIRRSSRLAGQQEVPVFYGKSSGYCFTRDAAYLKREISGAPPRISSSIVINEVMRARQEFWVTQPWMLQTLRPSEPYFRFPKPDLFDSLIDLYFIHVNAFLPLLHRSAFEKSLANSLHVHDEGFGATALLVCAIGCRFSDDPRIVHETSPSSIPTSWELFNQVGRLHRPLFSLQTIYDLQVHALGAIFLEASTVATQWILIGTGLRLVQEVGAHRRRLGDTKPSPENELWKRVFWVLLVLDRIASSALGRPCALQDEDFDVELPCNCDDDYWEHPDPERAFTQPPGKPSQMDFFLNFIKLNQILAFTLRTIYSIKKSRVILGYVGDQWESRVVAELDSALNKWEGSVPEFLRWDSHREDSVFFRQSAVLYCQYYEIQMLIHAPFIQARRSTQLSTPSLAICMNAARSCFHLLNGSRDRLKQVLHRCIVPLFTCCIMLALKAWQASRSDDPTNMTTHMEEVDKCLQMLQGCRDRFGMAGKLHDVINAMLHVNTMPPRRSKNMHFFSSKTVFVGPYPPDYALNDRYATKTPFDVDDAAVNDDTFYPLPSQLEKLFFARMNSTSNEQLPDLSSYTDSSTFHSCQPPQNPPTLAPPPVLSQSGSGKSMLPVMYNSMIDFGGSGCPRNLDWEIQNETYSQTDLSKHPDPNHFQELHSNMESVPEIGISEDLASCISSFFLQDR